MDFKVDDRVRVRGDVYSVLLIRGNVGTVIAEEKSDLADGWVNVAYDNGDTWWTAPDEIERVED